jgi:hypothetical protein
MSVSIGSVADLDAAIAAGLLPDNNVTRDYRAYLANPTVVHVDDLGGCTPEYQAFLDSIPEDRITANTISLTGLGECAITIGANAQIISIAKGNGPHVPVPPVESTVGN